MVSLRGGKKRLPNQYMEKLIEHTGKSSSELNYRMRFAEKYPTEEELSTAVDSFRSWTELRKTLVKNPRDKDKDKDQPQHETLPNMAERIEEDAFELKNLLSLQTTLELRELYKIHDRANAIRNEMDEILEAIEARTDMPHDEAS
jgi:hypothetical protein